MNRSRQHVSTTIEQTLSRYTVATFNEVRIHIIDQPQPSNKQTEKFTALASMILNNNLSYT